MQNKSPYVAAGLSIVPGLGHIYVGKPKKGLALLVIAAGMAAASYFFPSRLTVMMTAGLYLIVMVPAAVESLWIARTGYTEGNLNSKAYVIMMLLLTGFSALPLLWQDSRFSKQSKIAWSIAVPVLALCFFSALFRWGPELETVLF